MPMYPVRRQAFPVVTDPLQAQRYRTQRANEPEDLWQPLYDRANIATTVPSQVSFFSVPRGQSATLITATTAAAKTKSYRDTNLESANVVPTKLYKFVGLTIAFVHATTGAATNPADRDLVLSGGYLTFRIVDKDILFLPLINIPVLNPVVAVSTTANATTMFASNPGGGQGIFMYRLPINVTLNPFENFSVVFVFDGTITLSNTLDMMVVMQGYQRRPT